LFSNSVLDHIPSLRRRVLLDTVCTIGRFIDNRIAYTNIALKNVERWKHALQPTATASSGCIQIENTDWGDAAYILTQKYGCVFAVLNEANGILFGGVFT
jgi:hypothetical protein